MPVGEDFIEILDVPFSDSDSDLYEEGGWDGRIQLSDTTSRGKP